MVKFIVCTCELCRLFLFKNGLSQTSSPRGLPQSFRDQSRSFCECFLYKIASASFRGTIFFIFCNNIASANTARASAKHVGIEFANFEVKYEYRQMIYGEAILLSKQILRAYMQVKRGFGGASNF